MSSSEESDQLGYLAAQSETDESVSEELDQDVDGELSGKSDDEADQSADEAAKSSKFFDLEAADSDDETSGSEQSSIGDDNVGLDTWTDDFFFPQFRSLPFELRHRIWQLFCPDIAVKSRVYWFEAHTRYRRDGFEKVVAVEGPFLEQQTRPVRSLLAIHRETRELALKALPDTLSFGRRGIIRFNSANDVVFLGSLEVVMLDFEVMPRLRGFSEHIRHLAVDPAVLSDLGSRPSVLFEAFKNLRTVYYLASPGEHDPRHLRWCTSDKVKRYSVTTFEEEPGLGEDGQHLYCWPDIENHVNFAEAEVPLDGLANDLLMRDDPLHIKGMEFNGTPIWPMVQFLWDSDRRRFDDLQAWDGEGTLEWESSEGSDDDGDELDDYESEGIDDSDISEDDQASDSEESDVLHDDYSDQDRDVVGQGAIDLAGGESEDMARFSSPEQSSDTLGESEDSAQEPDLAGPRARRLKRPRARVVDSDSEKDSEAPIPQKRVRTHGARRSSVVLSSSDEEDARPRKRQNRRTRAVVPSDEEDEEEDDEADSDVGQGQNSRNDRSGTSSSEDDDEEPDNEATVSRPRSLAEKLQLHRKPKPIAPSSSDDDSSPEEMSEDNYDRRDYADFQDEEDEEISGDGDPHDEYDLEEEDEDQEDDEY
ncbi:hypothetical protein VTG60DRAFT_1184 [Thermothelomyces hinnuleus]